MKPIRFWYQPQLDVEFTWTEVESMILLSEHHYDFKCRELSQQGGMLYGMRNMFKLQGRGATIEYRLDITKADLLAKNAEADPSLRIRLVEITKTLTTMWRTVNPQ